MACSGLPATTPVRSTASPLSAQRTGRSVSFIKIGAYGETWPDIHLTPEQAVEANAKVQGRVLLPLHWGTFNLAFHAWDEPAERVVVAGSSTGTELIMPKPGESVEPATVRPLVPWWRAVRGAKP